MAAMHEIEYRIFGDDMQYVEVELDPNEATVAEGAPYPGKIVPIHLAEIGGELIAQKDSFLAAAKGVSIGIAFQRRLGVGLFGSEGFIIAAVPGVARGGREEGSLLGGLGTILDGDNS